MPSASVVVIGGTAGLGREVARHYAQQGRDVVVCGRDGERAAKVAAELGPHARGRGLDLARPHDLADALADIGQVGRLVLAAIERDHNPLHTYDVDAAVRLVTLKLVGYTEAVHTLRGRLAPDASIVIFGGQAKERPYPGSTTVSTVNGGVATMVSTLAVQLAPIRVNAIHPGIVGDSPYWSGKADYLESVRTHTPTGRLTTMADVTDAVVFLLENRAVNAVNLAVDGGWLLM
jgi:NAD(P)-dependent dehydrogenase (short-subunit alcohol dehydrogenase family)